MQNKALDLSYGFLIRFDGKLLEFFASGRLRFAPSIHCSFQYFRPLAEDRKFGLVLYFGLGLEVLLQLV